MKKGNITSCRGEAEVMGLDLSDVLSTFVGIDGEGKIIEEGKAATTRVGIEKLFWRRKRTRIAIEAGAHSPWVSRLLAELGHEVIVANPRKIALITRNQRKSDRLDAITLARLARADAELLHPLKHRGKQAQVDLAVLRSRDALVSNRTQLVNHVRGVVKSFGERLPKCSTESFHHKALASLPQELVPALKPVIEQIAQLTEKIRSYDQQIERLIEEDYPEALLLQQVNGVGPITSLAYVLTIEDPQRFATSRDVPAYLGLTPGRDQSGERDPQMRITKAGDVFLRRLLVQSAHYVIGPFGTDSDLRRWGLKLAGPPVRGKVSKQPKKRAVVAVARKLTVLLHALWRSAAPYEPLRLTLRKEAA